MASAATTDAAAAPAPAGAADATGRDPSLIVLFDVDGTLTPARKVKHERKWPMAVLPIHLLCHANSLTTFTFHPHEQKASAEILEFLKTLRKKVYIGMVGGSDLVKQKEQLGEDCKFVACWLSCFALLCFAYQRAACLLPCLLALLGFLCSAGHV